ncbi:hypothetical protein ACQPYH_28310 [Kribbella sp. CA-245084]|uniref:hypothetical protein n=1 Tax=Kribbella sp. CA-245084 TaxID=3239940 RepID=UPI003D915879
MNRTCCALAVSTLAFGAAVLTGSEALAEPHPDPGLETIYNHPYNYPEYRFDTPVTQTTPNTTSSQVRGDNNRVEFLQVGASALGGAGLALGGLWLYRRHHAPVT